MNPFPAIAKSIVEEVALPKPKQQAPAQGQKAAAMPAKPATPVTKQPEPVIKTASVQINRLVASAPKPSSEIVLFFGTLSLTRAIVFNALVRSFAETKEKVFVVSGKSSLETLKWMWGDLPNICVVGHGSTARWPAMQASLKEAGKDWTGFSHAGLNWDRLSYEGAGVNFEDRWSKFIVGGYPSMTPPTIPLPQSPRYALIHDDAEKGWHIRKELLPKGGLKHIRIDKSHPNLFAWQGLIENATEIHCVPSAVAVLADSIPTKASKLVLHSYARPNRINPATKKNWAIA